MKAFYLISYQTTNGARFNTGYQTDKEIGSAEELNAMTNAVGRHAVSQGQSQSIEGVIVIGCTLMNPGRDVEVIANEMLEQAFVELYEKFPVESSDRVGQNLVDMYMNIKGIEDLGNEGEA